MRTYFGYCEFKITNAPDHYNLQSSDQKPYWKVKFRHKRQHPYQGYHDAPFAPSGQLGPKGSRVTRGVHQLVQLWVGDSQVPGEQLVVGGRALSIDL